MSGAAAFSRAVAACPLAVPKHYIQVTSEKHREGKGGLYGWPKYRRAFVMDDQLRPAKE